MLVPGLADLLAQVSKTGGCRFESCRPCWAEPRMCGAFTFRALSTPAIPHLTRRVDSRSKLPAAGSAVRHRRGGMRNPARSAARRLAATDFLCDAEAVDPSKASFGAKRE